MSALLYLAEHELLEVLADAYNRFQQIVGGAPSAQGDLEEITAHIHGLQRMVLSQAAARAYPDKYRKLGGVVDS